MSNQNIADLLLGLKIEELLQLKKELEAKGITVAATAVASTNVEDKPKVEEKSVFDLFIKSYPAESKIKVITTLSKALGLKLADAKALVEAGATKSIKDGISKDEVKKIQDMISESVSGVVFEAK